MPNVRSQSDPRIRLLWVLSAATFLIFFQAFMVAPLIPHLASFFNVSVGTIGLIVPAYLLPYGATTLVYGPLSDRLGRRTIILASFAGFILFTGFTALADSAAALFWLRLITGLVASGVVPIALALVGDHFDYKERGRALGWLFGAMAGGMAFGSTLGAVLEPFLTWQGLFLGVAVLSILVFITLIPFQTMLDQRVTVNVPSTLRQVGMGLLMLLKSKRGARTYTYVLFNGIFHSGVFTWLGYYFAKRYGLGDVGVGLALLGYGIPGFLFGPVIGRLADRMGRSHFIPIGFVIAGLSTAKK
ncbi:MFS transporter [Fodinisporobacter ferrooxydans]|uniref:MFS transporter n=1 Tax=Fodinisporobacter ferrooxydans TaxID=2901836 RepID=A0ABY4CHM3_9BACL|nr:MFS transporter [Alicyclobacillaceae bacterium MYW30-H2]